MRHEDRNPQGQTASAGYSHEGSGTPRNLSGTAKGIKCLVQVQVPGHTGGIWREAQGFPTPLQVLEEASDNGAVAGGTTDYPSTGREV